MNGPLADDRNAALEKCAWEMRGVGREGGELSERSVTCCTQLPCMYTLPTLRRAAGLVRLFQTTHGPRGHLSSLEANSHKECNAACPAKHYHCHPPKQNGSPIPDPKAHFRASFLAAWVVSLLLFSPSVGVGLTWPGASPGRRALKGENQSTLKTNRERDCVRPNWGPFWVTTTTGPRRKG
uniref:Uncharacterized protein n=1 Tax=Eutreptiella gymnastica TaxID=73025 RepID=A0A7S1NB18_9EUGL